MIMQLWYAICDLLPIELLQWDFMKNALLAIIIMCPLFGLVSTMIVTGKMSFFSDALGHSAFTGIAIGCICGIGNPTWVAVVFSVVFALLFSFVRSRSSQTADTLIGVFSSTAVALGIFIATFGGGSFTKYNTYLIGDILSVTPGQIGMLAIILVSVILFWVIFNNKMVLTSIYPQLASSRGISTALMQTVFTTVIAVIVTLAISWVGLLILNSLLVLPGAASRNVSKNLKQYHLFSVIFALTAGIAGLVVSYFLGTSAGASICLVLAFEFIITFCLRKVVK
jgi:zinc transport system permease protein